MSATLDVDLFRRFFRVAGLGWDGVGYMQQCGACWQLTACMFLFFLVCHQVAGITCNIVSWFLVFFLANGFLCMSWLAFIPGLDKPSCAGQDPSGGRHVCQGGSSESQG